MNRYYVLHQVKNHNTHEMHFTLPSGSVSYATLEAAEQAAENAAFHSDLEIQVVEVVSRFQRRCEINRLDMDAPVSK